MISESMKHISIIGGAGFIGTRLAYLLEQNQNIDFNIIDKVSSYSFPSKSKIVNILEANTLFNSINEDSIIINLAAEHRDDVRPLSLYNEVNVVGARNICEVARSKDVKIIVFTSSVAVYGFAPINTDENGQIAPFNEYGRTKYEAEKVYKEWQAEEPNKRTLVIVRPTVVFGEQNRGNVYNLLRQVASGKFVMVGDGENRKSLAYVENVAAFLKFSTTAFKSGVHIYNYIDKPDSNMNSLVGNVNCILGKPELIRFRIPYTIGYAIGKCFDTLAAISGKKFAISAIRIKKFCTNSVYETSVPKTSFIPPIELSEALERTVRHEFIESHHDERLFYTE
jgi:nucleoside-diphosphate-sugar epimerase